MSPSVSIPSRFNGPLDSGNGGYCSGVLAGFVDGPAQVSLRSPVPLDRELEVTADADGSARMVDGETLVAEAHRVAVLGLDIPPPVAPADARAAMQGYRGLHTGPFCRCFVCGRAREDTLGVFAGQVEGRDVVASTWTPPASAADGDGHVRPEVVWAVLDCPTYFAAHIGDDLSLSFLVRLTARIDAPVTAEHEHVVIAWPIERDGRKRRAGSAVLTAEGKTLAVADALLVEPRT
ncbi:MAG TPA: hypothetical protein VEX36_09670 [Thermoleophilaceae bacterium]|nr:hypothetical protein [Thermoleophilaceae bacterium]